MIREISAAQIIEIPIWGSVLMAILAAGIALHIGYKLGKEENPKLTTWLGLLGMIGIVTLIMGLSQPNKEIESNTTKENIQQEINKRE